MKCIRELKELMKDISAKGALGQNDVNYIFLKIRQLLENERKYQNEFPVVNLFCNWVVHTKLKDSKTIYRFLVDVSKHISSAIHLSNGEDPQEATRQFINVAGNIIQIPTLRAGIKAIFHEQGIDNFITNKKDWWDAFVVLLLTEISGKPLEFPDEVVNGKYHKRASKFFDELSSLPHIYDWDKVIRLIVFDKNEKYYIRLESIGRAQYVVELMGNEPKEMFAS